MRPTERIEKITLIVIAVILIVAVSVLAAFRLHNNNEPPDALFTPPQFDAAAIKGAPDETVDSYDSIDLSLTNGKCAVAMDVKPKLDKNKLQVNLTSSEDNTVWIRIVLYDGDLNVAGETGLIRPGEYVEAVTLTKEIKSGDPLKVKLITYEPDTYYSMGTASATIIAQ